MKLKSKEEILLSLGRQGVVPVYFNEDFLVAKSLVEVCYQAGMNAFEFTNRGDGAFSVFRQLINLKKKLPGLILGAGTVLHAEDAEKFIVAGADFIVSPILDIKTGKVCHQYDALWVPGCGSVTEVSVAHKHGAGLIKIFPGSVLGPSFIKSTLSVMPHLKLMPTGGVEPQVDNLKTWFDAGAFCVGIGSSLFSKVKITSKRKEEVGLSLTQLTELVGKLKEGHN